jgi:signal transduction histidine kinase
MAERIARVVRDQRELLAAISHELRSPLGRARVALEIVRDRTSTLGEEGRAVRLPVDDIERQLTDVDAILGDLLAAARAGLSDVKPVPTPIAAWVRARLAAEPTPPALELTTQLDDGVTVPIDAALLNRALHNVLANARAYGHPPSEPIEVSLSGDGARIVLVTRDRGPGFPENILPRAFEPFVRGDAARTPGGGYGLGLALVRRIAEAHGGRAFARNAPGGGAEVGIDLPRARRGG